MTSKVWGSPDGGASWQLLSSGLPSEDVNFLSVDEVVQGAGLSIKSKGRIVQGASTGLYSLKPTAVKNAQCKLSVETLCKRPVKKGVRCSFTAKIKESKKAAAKATTRLMRRTNSAAAWKALGAGRKTDRKGKALYKVTVKNTGFYTLQSDGYNCASNQVKVTVKASGERSTMKISNISHAKRSNANFDRS